jgi:hypothetical protein
VQLKPKTLHVQLAFLDCSDNIKCAEVSKENTRREMRNTRNVSNLQFYVVVLCQHLTEN